MCEATPDAAVTLQMDQRAAVRARQFLDDHWCPEHAHQLRPQAELIVSELVADAVRRGTPPIRVSLRCDGHESTLSVTDGAPDQPPDPSHVQLVDLLSDAWGVSTRPGQQTVWSRLVV
ncbi:ATP-binding protein [Angustibacter aerolatus]